MARPVPIPESLIWEGGSRHVLAAPNGDLTDPDIAPVEAIIDLMDGIPRYSMLVRLEPGDLEHLQNDPHLWLVQQGDHLHPWSLVPAETKEEEGA